MIDSLAEQVFAPVRTATRVRFNVGSAWPLGPENPWEVAWNGTGVIACPVTGSTVGCLSLNTVFSNVLPVVVAGPAIM